LGNSHQEQNEGTSSGKSGPWRHFQHAGRGLRLSRLASLRCEFLLHDRFPQRGRSTTTWDAPIRPEDLVAQGPPSGCWLIVEGGCIVFNTFHKSAMAGALARDSRVALCTDLEEPPYAFVQVQGEAELSKDPGELLRIATMIAARYMGPGRAEEFGKRNGVSGELIVRLRPTKVLAGFNLTG
jgi:PPOX class probable F420-dependent enzyme